jgi:hypothetical protein
MVVDKQDPDRSGLAVRIDHDWRPLFTNNEYGNPEAADNRPNSSCILVGLSSDAHSFVRVLREGAGGVPRTGTGNGVRRYIMAA